MNKKLMKIDVIKLINLFNYKVIIIMNVYLIIVPQRNKK